MFIDVHAHAYRMPHLNADGTAAFATPAQLLKRYDDAAIDQGCLLPVLGPELNVPQSVSEIIDMARQSGGRLIPFCNVDPRMGGNHADSDLGPLLRFFRDQGCRGIGEVMPQMEMTHPKCLNLFKHVEAVGFPMIIDITGHLEDGWYGLFDDHGLPQLEACLQRFPKLIIVGHGPGFWAEIAKPLPDQPRGGWPTGPVQEEGAVPKLLRRYPNLWADLSAGSGAGAIMRDREYGIRFLREFQDKLMFGTDICAPNQPFRMVDHLLALRKERRLDEAAFVKIARGNAQRLLEL